MARILPSDLSELSFSSDERAEIRTLDVLRTGLPSSYVVYHSVHWAKDTSHRSMFGEADFVIVNQGGEVAVIEQKSGTLEESSSGLLKRYYDGRKSVPVQIHRTLDGIREQFKRQSGHDISLDYLIYCPDYRVRDLNSAGVTASRIVDARDASRLVERVIGVLPPGIASDFGKRVHRFFE